MPKKENIRVAKNTAFLYIRMLFVMAVTLFTSRIILEALGVIDFGIYNVVGGLSSALVFFSSSLTISTQRYLNFELGRENIEKVKNIFNTSLLMFSLIAVLVFIVGITFGKWIVTNELVIPDEKKNAAVIVLYATIVTFCSSFVFSVYESVLIARENMKIYAYLGIIDAIAKLGIAYLILIVHHKLIVYAWLLLIVQVFPKICMAIYCIKRYPEVKHELFWDKHLFRELMSFTGWNVYGSSVWMINGQGINILLNMFFGPVVNAANGIATQVNNAVNNFSTNFFTAVRPQIVKRYSSSEFDSLLELIYSSSRLSFFLLWCISLPLILRCNYVLSIWLKDIPKFATIFVQWILFYSMVNSFVNPVWTAMSATGDLKKSVLIGSNLFLLAFPASYLSLKAGFSPQIVFLLLSIGRIAFLLVTLHYLSNYININLKNYIIKVIKPVVCVILVSLLLSFIINNYVSQTFIGLMTLVLFTLLINILSIYYLGITKYEKGFVNRLIFQYKDKIKK